MEHLQHFGLNQDPFSNEPDLRFYFESASHQDAQRRVERSLRQSKGLTLLTGEGGMGKSLLARRILDNLEEEVFEAVLLVMLPGVADAVGILQRFARQLGVEEPSDDRASLLAQVYEHLAIVREDGRHAVLMIDDAQIMAPEVLSELGGLLNLEYEDRRLLSMLLVGSSELDRLVQADAGISPRIEVRVRLQPLSEEATAAYLQHRLGLVGGDLSLVPESALDTLQKFGRGRPRLLNTLADNALFEAYLAGRTTLEAGDIERAAADLGVGSDPGMTWIAPAPAAPLTAAVSFAPESEPISSAFADELAPAAAGEGAASNPMDDFLDAAPVAAPTDSPLEPGPMAELELSLDMVEPTETAPAPPPVFAEALETAAPAEAAAAPSLGSELDQLDFGSEPLEFALEEAELSAADGEELEGVYVELLDE